MKRCPDGHRRVGNKCVPISKVTRSGKGSMGPRKDPWRFQTVDELQKASDPYADFRKLGSLIYKGWMNRPKLPGEAKEWQTFPQLKFLEAAADIQINVLKDISEGKYRDVDMYSPTERERTETLGFKPIWSPGGFQV